MLKQEQLTHVERSATGYRLVPFRKMKISFGSIDDLVQLLTVEEFNRKVERRFDVSFESSNEEPADASRADTAFRIA